MSSLEAKETTPSLIGFFWAVDEKNLGKIITVSVFGGIKTVKTRSRDLI